MKIIPYLFLLNSQYSWATPIAQGGAIANPCVINTGDRKSYTITSQNDVVGEPDQLPFWCTPQGGARMLFCLDQDFFSLPPDHAKMTLACIVGRSQSFSVAVTVTVGAGLGLEFEGIASAGLEASVSITTETGTTDEAGTECNGPWSCGLLMIPTLREVSGEQTTTSSGCESSSHTDPYTARFPLKDGNSPKAGFTACACKNKLAWADPGAPPPCPNDC